MDWTAYHWQTQDGLQPVALSQQQLSTKTRGDYARGSADEECGLAETMTACTVQAIDGKLGMVRRCFAGSDYTKSRNLHNVLPQILRMVAHRNEH
eukprot:2514136-Amphidinium_carterae.2